MFRKQLTGIVFLVFAIAIGGSVDYSGYKVVTAIPDSEAEVELLLKLRSDYGVDLWNEPKALNTPIMIHIRPELADVVINALKQHNIEYFIAIEDVQSAIISEKIANAPSNESRAVLGFDFGRYNKYDDIVKLLVSLTSQYNKLSVLETIGTTFENRPIYAVRISSGGFGTKPVVMMECGIHAREWSSVAAGVYIVKQLLTAYGTDSLITNLVNQYEFYVIPEANPDGYVYTWTTDRLWRKTRSRSSLDWLGVCRGADANRNFDIEHCGVGTSRKPCDEIYCGDRPFSENEARALKDLMVKIGNRMKVYFSIHAFSQLWMTPYGTTKKMPPNYSTMMQVANAGARALAKRYNTVYKVGSIANIIYEAAGSSVDYAYVKQNIKLAFALELRDTGRFGFFLPPQLILPTCEETLDGLLAAVQAA